ncbi:MAG: sigma 54-interacting transcriptional regulator [Verrucomicrobiales bacterium]|nr:sigma 54-interacting transcriptional regulator [Verrucomicrobiales bacterium]
MNNTPTIVEASSNTELAALRAIVEGTAQNTGEEFFRALVRHLAGALGVQNALVAEFAASEMRVRTLAWWKVDQLAPSVEYDLAGTPCEDVVRGKLCHHPSGVARKFATDAALVEMGIESYLGVPLVAPDGRHLGHLCVFDSKPMPKEPRNLIIFRIFASRAAAELARLRLERDLAESEQRFRDLYEEAPIAYVQEDLESRFISANRAAMRILGITPEQVPGTVGMSFIPDTPDAQRRVKEAFASVGRGTDTSGVVLELRRKDNGKPIWIQWWSKPDPSGKYTRTMFVDITDKVLMEQEKNRLTAENIYLQEELKSVHNFEEIVGQSPALLDVIEKVNRVAKTDASVFITGETGTGKELFARAIHSASARRDKPLIKLNCAALPASLVESELFGHEKGAFSGAIQRRIGRFELAQGGTIFLDEIGEVPPDVQVKLLRVLQEREFERVGGSTPIKIDVRVIAATNRDLPKAIREGKFREDLFYRLNVFPIALPPMRDRAGDLPLLVQFLVAKFGARVGRRIEAIEKKTMALLEAYRWPGNIRELENILERAIILSNGSTLAIDPEVFGSTAIAAASGPRPTIARGDAADAPAKAGDLTTQSADSLETIERNHVLAVLGQTDWVIDGPRGAAKILDLHPNTLRSRMKKLGIKRGTRGS